MPRLTWNPPKVPERVATYRWDVDYAAQVHEGEGAKPARRWTDYAIGENNPAISIAHHYQSSESMVTAFDAMAQELNQGFRVAIESPIWDWPRATVRSDGSVVGSPRDIVDTGRLRDSQSLTLS